jgi:hypothetical protein
LNDTLPLFALNLEDTTTTSGASEQRNHDSDHLKEEEDFDVDVFGTDMDDFLEEYDDYNDWFLDHAPPPLNHFPTMFVVWVPILGIV